MIIRIAKDSRAPARVEGIVLVTVPFQKDFPSLGRLLVLWT